MQTSGPIAQLLAEGAGPCFPNSEAPGTSQVLGRYGLRGWAFGSLGWVDRKRGAGRVGPHSARKGRALWQLSGVAICGRTAGRLCPGGQQVPGRGDGFTCLRAEHWAGAPAAHAYGPWVVDAGSVAPDCGSGLLTMWLCGCQCPASDSKGWTLATVRGQAGAVDTPVWSGVSVAVRGLWGWALCWSGHQSLAYGAERPLSRRGDRRWFSSLQTGQGRVK